MAQQSNICSILPAQAGLTGSFLEEYPKRLKEFSEIWQIGKGNTLIFRPYGDQPARELLYDDDGATFKWEQKRYAGGVLSSKKEAQVVITKKEGDQASSYGSILLNMIGRKGQQNVR